MRHWLPSTISFKSKNNPSNKWYAIRTIFRPRDSDFKHMTFKINGKIYTEPSPEFYKEFETIAIWHSLSEH